MTSAPQITIYQKSGGIISKSCYLDAAGAFVKDGGACSMSSGRAYRRDLLGSCAATALAGVLGTMPSDQAISLGRMRPEVGAEIAVVVEAREGVLPAGPISRTAKHFLYASDVPAWLLVDVDLKGAPDAIRERLAAVGIVGILGSMPSSA